MNTNQINSNVLILLHGLGDTSTNFKQFGLKLSLPQTEILSLEANFEIPLFENGKGWWKSFDKDGNLLSRYNCRVGITNLIDCLTKMFDKYPPERIFVLGFGQGSEILELYLNEHSTIALGGAISISGTRLSHSLTPTLNMNELPRNRNETLLLMKFFSKRLWLRNLALEQMADRVVDIEKLS
jgi:predicted esterase